MLINNRVTILLDKENLLKELISIESDLHRNEIFDAIKSINSLKKKIYEAK